MGVRERVQAPRMEWVPVVGTMTNRSGTRVSESARRRTQANAAIAKMRHWGDAKLTVCPEHGTRFKGMCLHAAVCAYGRANSAPFDSVQDLWQREKGIIHTGKSWWNPPRGAFVIYRDDNPGDRYNRHGHVLVSNGRGKGWGVDRPVDGRVGLVDLHDPCTHWGMVYAGWVWPWQLWKM